MQYFIQPPSFARILSNRWLHSFNKVSRWADPLWYIICMLRRILLPFLALQLTSCGLFCPKTCGGVCIPKDEESDYVAKKQGSFFYVGFNAKRDVIEKGGSIDVKLSKNGESRFYSIDFRDLSNSYYDESRSSEEFPWLISFGENVSDFVDGNLNSFCEESHIFFGLSLGNKFYDYVECSEGGGMYLIHLNARDDEIFVTFFHITTGDYCIVG